MNGLKYFEAIDLFVLNVLDIVTNVYICLTTFRPSLIFEPGDEKDWSDRDRDWFERFDYGEGWQVRDGKISQSQISKRSFIKESQQRGGKSQDIQDSTGPVRNVSSMTDDRDKGARDKLSGNRSQIKDSSGKKLTIKYILVVSVEKRKIRKVDRREKCLTSLDAIPSSPLCSQV